MQAQTLYADSDAKYISGRRFDACGKTTRKAAFLARMNKPVPWTVLQDLTKPHYPKTGNSKPPRALARAQRIPCYLLVRANRIC
jgi:hypothetical protein